MNQPTTEKVRWNTTDLALFPEDGKRYEIITGNISEFVSESVPL